MFEGPVEHIEASASDGYLGVLAHHAALVTGLAPGTLTVRKYDGKTETWVLSGGFFEVSNNRVSVLAGGAAVVTVALVLHARHKGRRASVR